jgi:hypothetical protein
MIQAAKWTIFLGTLVFGATVHADIHLKLGSVERVKRLFSFPNNCNVICYRNWRLEETVEHYLRQSLQRDGYSEATVRVELRHGNLHADIKGVPKSYGEPLKAFLDAGDLAYAGARKLNSAGKWAYNWSLLLPLGLALENRKSIQLLHFPPDYTLTKDQDYLVANTTLRWASLLSINGVATAQAPAYQTTIDIVPIAAPATAGSDFKNIYDYFKDYQLSMVKSFSRTVHGDTLPMVVFGTPARQWIKTHYGKSLEILGLIQISPDPGAEVPVLGANHPSYIWYAADPAAYGGDVAKADAVGLQVMGQDLSAACWQAAMGSKAANDPRAQLNTCTQTWQVTQKEKTCELFYTSIRHLAPERAVAQCSAMNSQGQLDHLQEPVLGLAAEYL